MRKKLPAMDNFDMKESIEPHHFTEAVFTFPHRWTEGDAWKLIDWTTLGSSWASPCGGAGAGDWRNKIAIRIRARSVLECGGKHKRDAAFVSRTER